MGNESSSGLSTRVSANERALREAAELAVLEQRGAVIPAADWERFEAWLRHPPEVIPALAELSRRRPAWEE